MRIPPQTVTAITTAVVAVATAVKEQHLLDPLGPWGGILVMLIGYGSGILSGWLGYEKPASMRPPPMPPQVPYGKDLRGP